MKKGLRIIPKKNNLLIQPGGVLQGRLVIPGDKSITHRALIFGALYQAKQKVILHNWLQSLDCSATLMALQAMGVMFEELNTSSLQISSVGLHGLEAPTKILDVGNSGTTIRLLTGVLAAQKFSSKIGGDASICCRPMRRIIIPLTQMGAKITATNNEYAPLSISGGQTLRAINYDMPIASAQVKSAILLASLYATSMSFVNSAKVCRNHTELMLQHFCADYNIPADISTAAFFMVGASIAAGSDIVLENIGINPTRTAVIEILKRMGANITLSNVRLLHGEWRADIFVQAAKRLTAITVPLELVANAIDELPIICLAAACASGTTVIRGAAELRYKESDRIAMLVQNFQELGVVVSAFSDGLAITGGVISGGRVTSGGDHRIAMTFAMAGLVAQGEIIIQNTQNIATSFPSFVDVALQAGMLISEESIYA